MTRLTLGTADPKVIELLHGFFSQLNELECNFGALSVMKFPVLKLDKLYLNENIANKPGNLKSIYVIYPFLAEISRIFRHDVKTLETFYGKNQTYGGGPLIKWVFNWFISYLLFSESNVGQASIEHLMLRGNFVPLVPEVLPIVINFCDYFSKLKKLTLKMIITNFYVSHILKGISNEHYFQAENSLFGNEFVERCDDIMSFKEQVKGLLSELTVDLSIMYLAWGSAVRFY